MTTLDVTLIGLTPTQLETTEMMISVCVEKLATLRRESTFSEIAEKRWKTALEVQKILREAIFK